MRPAKKPRVFYGWWIVLSGAVISFYLGGVYFHGFGLFFTPFIDEFGWSYSTLSLALALRSAETGLFAPVLGFLVDRFGPRKLMMGGALLSGASAIWLSRVHSLGEFYATMLLLALGTSTLIHSVVPMTAVANWFRRKIGKATGLLVIGFSIGGVLVPVVAWMLNGYGWRTSMVIIGIGIWVICLPLSLVVRHKPEQYGYLPDGETAAEFESEAAAAGAANQAEVEYTVRQALKTTTFWLLVSIHILVFMSLTTFYVHVIPFLESVGFTRQGAAFAITGVTLISTGGRLLFGWLADIWDKRKLLAVSVALLASGVLILAHVRSVTLLIPFLIIFGFGQGGMVPTRLAILRVYFGRKAYGSIVGIVMMSTTLITVAAPPLAGWIFDTRGSYYLAWIVFALATAMAVPLILMLKPPLQGKSSHENHV